MIWRYRIIVNWNLHSIGVVYAHSYVCSCGVFLTLFIYKYVYCIHLHIGTSTIVQRRPHYFTDKANVWSITYIYTLIGSINYRVYRGKFHIISLAIKRLCARITLLLLLSITKWFSLQTALLPNLTPSLPDYYFVFSSNK